MGKKRKRKKSDNGSKNSDGKTNLLFYGIGAVFVLMLAFVGLRNAGFMQGTFEADPQEQAYLDRVVKAGLKETRPLMPYANYKGRAATTYRLAREIPEVLDALYCYCNCSKNPRIRHKTLLTCFTDDHASNCGICMSQMEMAYRMAKKGESIKDIRIAVDKSFGNMS